MLKSIPVIILFLISLLSVFPAPTYHTWLLAVGVTEYPWVFIIVTVVVLILGLAFFNYPLLTTIIGICSLTLFLSPIIRATMIASTMESELRSTFGGKAPSFKPFSAFSMLKAVDISDYKPIEYKKAGSKILTFDFYKSKLAGKRPCVLVIHGGSWSSGDSKQLPELNSALTEQGYHVAALNYRKVPEYKHPAPVEDVKDAIEFLNGNSNELQIDSENFILLGRSAGGQIALLAAYTLSDLKIKGVIDFYGPADMVWGYSIPSNPLVMDSRGVMENYLGGTYKEVAKNYESSSPIYFVGKKSPPTLMIHGDNDVLVSPKHSLKLRDKLQQNGVKNYLLQLPWAVHGFDYNLKGPGGQLSTYAVTYFIKTVIN